MEMGRCLVHVQHHIEHPQMGVAFCKGLRKIFQSCRRPFSVRRTANFKLRLSDYVYDTHDYAFLRFNFTKEGTSEGVNGTYAHQKLSIAFNPSFSIDRYGVISASGGFSIVNYYVQEKGYVSINW